MKKSIPTQSKVQVTLEERCFYENDNSVSQAELNHIMGKLIYS